MVNYIDISMHKPLLNNLLALLEWVIDPIY